MARSPMWLPRETKKPMLAGLEWSERYNCFHAVVAGWLTLSFSWSLDRSQSGYHITVGGRKLKVRGTSAEDSAAKAVAAARALLSKALAALPAESAGEQR
jgi:hypothetical protein